MSGKRRRRPAGTQRPLPTENQPAGGRPPFPDRAGSGPPLPVSLRALDGYANAPAALGEYSPLAAAGTFLRSGVTADPELLTAAYRTNWLAKRIIDMPAEDMTRAWYRPDGLPEEAVRRLRSLESRHAVRRELADAIRWARLYGGAIALMVIRGEEDILDRPLDKSALLPDCFQGLLVLDRARGVTPSAELVTDLDDPDFGLPAYYEAELAEDGGTVRLHHSRVLRFTGRDLPQREAEREQYWGASELEHVWEELQKRSATSANIAQLVFQAHITTLHMGDFGELLAFGTDEQRAGVLAMMEQQNRFRSNFGLQVMSNADTMENLTYSFAGLPEIYELFMTDMAGAAEIPATRLFGRSPQGMNATGESDMKNYYEFISQQQERLLRPALERLLPVMLLSCLGEAPEETGIVFGPLTVLSPMEKAEIAARRTASVTEAYAAGLLTREEARQLLVVDTLWRDGFTS